MGLLDRFFSRQNTINTNEQIPRVDENCEKERLANKIVDLVSDIKRIDSFDSTIWNLSNSTSYDLQRKSLNELNIIKTKLENRLMELKEKSQRVDPSMERLEAAKWTGERLPGMSAEDLDRLQNSDNGR